MLKYHQQFIKEKEEKMGMRFAVLERTEGDANLRLVYNGPTTRRELGRLCGDMRKIEETVILYTTCDGKDILYIEDFAYPHSIRNALRKIMEERVLSGVRIQKADEVSIRHWLRSTLMAYFEPGS